MVDYRVMGKRPFARFYTGQCIVNIFLGVILEIAKAQPHPPPSPVSSQRSAGKTGALIVAYVFMLTFAASSCIYAVLGLGVAYQWPRPHCFCYNDYRSDLTGKRHCCSLYRINIVYSALWIIFFVVTAVGRNVPRMVICLVFAVVHCAIIALFTQKFKKYGGPT